VFAQDGVCARCVHNVNLAQEVGGVGDHPVAFFGAMWFLLGAIAQDVDVRCGGGHAFGDVAFTQQGVDKRRFAAIEFANDD